jgi:hypothetical protein
VTELGRSCLGKEFHEPPQRDREVVWRIGFDDFEAKLTCLVSRRTTSTELGRPQGAHVRELKAMRRTQHGFRWKRVTLVRDLNSPGALEAVLPQKDGLAELPKFVDRLKDSRAIGEVTKRHDKTLTTWRSERRTAASVQLRVAEQRPADPTVP